MSKVLKSLDEIANLHGTDKGTIGPSKQWGAHNFTDVYAAYMEKNRDKKISLLEVGLGVTGDSWQSNIVHGRNSGGASIKMWYDYFPNADIYGIDVNPCSYLDNDRVKTFVVDQGNPKELDKFIETTKGVEFDYIIDDGSHRADHQQITLDLLFHKVKSGGVYFIEDLSDNGFDDGEVGRHSCDNVLSTRKLLKHYKQYREFLSPNLLTNKQYLNENIEYLNFHSPLISFDVGLKASFRRPIHKTVRYNLNSELLCAISKC